VRGDHKTFEVPQHQADAYVDQANPVSGTKYEWSSDGTQANKLGALKNVRIISLAAMVTWTVQPSPLEVWITIDGVAMRFFFNNPVTATQYYPSEKPGLDVNNQGLDVTIFRPYQAFLLEGRSVKVEIETTGGTVANLDLRVKYTKW